MAATFFVTGATGGQGGATARKLLAQGQQVNALVRDPNSDSAQALAKLGAKLHHGAFEDVAALREAARGCQGVFLNTSPTRPGETEVQNAKNVVSAAREAGVRRIVVSTVARAEEHEQFPDYPDGLMHARGYWRAKTAIQRLVQEAEFEAWTVLQPAWLMGNWIAPTSNWYFPELKTEHVMVAAYATDTKVDLTDPEDVGGFAAAALADPDPRGQFASEIVRLAGDVLTPEQIVQCLSKVSGEQVKLRLRSEDEIEALKGESPFVASQNWQRLSGTRVDVEALKKYKGVTLTSFEAFLETNKERLMQALTV